MIYETTSFNSDEFDKQTRNLYDTSRLMKHSSLFNYDITFRYWISMIVVLDFQNLKIQIML
jgi:hypothetical protein